MQKIIQGYLKYSKYLVLGKNFLAVLGFSLSISGFSQIRADELNSSPDKSAIPQLLISQENALISQASPNNPDLKVVRKIGAVITAYSSTVWQTDDSPFITAAGTRVKDGIIANNYLPFGSKVRIPELYGDKVFVVEDRMSWQKGNYHFDIWFADYWQAINFGAKRASIEVLGS